MDLKDDGPIAENERYESTLEQRLREMYWRMKTEAEMEPSE